MPVSPACSPADGFCLTDWLGIPFVPDGRDRQGADCYGLVWLFHAEVLGIRLPRLQGLVPDVENPRTAGAVMTAEAERPTWRQVAAPRFGDILAFGTPTLFYHVGLYLAPGRMLHTRAGTDSTPENYMGPLWRPRLQGFFRARTRS
ncbi:MAG: hypothetical protein EP335_17415 [Alphaproteobacteria bacterium]|nr:MAG: hypothetical protein EP335_17415 [Alphaproteobacteria bacterium]